MLAALRRALAPVPRPSDSIHESLAKGWDEAIDRALRDDEQLDCLFPAEVFAEPHWRVTNEYSPTPEQDAAASLV
jgi:hypothetical protein